MFPVTLLLKLTCFTLFFSPSFSSRLFRGPHISREDESLTWKSYGRRSVFHVARVYVCSPLSFWLLVPNKHHVLFCTNTHRHKKNKPHPSVFLFSNGFSLWHSQTLRDVCRVIVCVCSSFSHHSHFPSNRQAEKHMALSFCFWLIYLCLSSVFVYIFLKFSVALSHFAKLSRPSPDMSKMPFQFNCSKCKKKKKVIMSWIEVSWCRV